MLAIWIVRYFFLPYSLRLFTFLFLAAESVPTTARPPATPNSLEQEVHAAMEPTSLLVLTVLVDPLLEPSALLTPLAVANSVRIFLPHI